MSWWGKLLGGWMGFQLGGPLGLLLGMALGHNFDKGLRGVTQEGGGGMHTERRQLAFFAATFTVMGHVCKLDGKVSREEIRMAERIMRDMSLDAEQRQFAMDLFRQGKDLDPAQLPRLLEQFRAEIGRQPNLHRFFLEIQVMAACADGELHAAERAALLEICRWLGISSGECQRLIDMVMGSFASRSSSASVSVEEAYRILGVSETADAGEIKRAYRRLLNQHHPDKLVSKGVPEEMIKVASERTVEIRKAYEALKSHRDF